MMISQGGDMAFSEPTAGGTVAASDGINVYEVWQFKGARKEWECTCTAYRSLNKQCKHITAIRDTVKSGKKSSSVINFFNNAG
jgi:hypothetical protein